MSDKPLIEEIREIIWTPPPLPDIEDYSGTSEADEITRLRAENAELRGQRDRARLALDVALAAGAECEGHIAELRAENAAKDARIAELEGALRRIGSWVMPSEIIDIIRKALR